MSTEPNHHDDQAPDALQADLRALFGRTPEVPPAVDAAVLAAYRRRRWWWGMLAGVGSAVAAGIMVAVGVWVASDSRPAYARTGDIRDAFYVARQLESGQNLSPAWDVNADGTVNQADVAALAQSAVQVKGATP